MTNYDYDFYVGDHQVAVVDVDEGSEGGKSLDFYKKPTSLLWPCAPHPFYFNKSINRTF